MKEQSRVIKAFGDAAVALGWRFGDTGDATAAVDVGTQQVYDCGNSFCTR